ncbi:hypothetical protein [Endozoicomonas sp. YOMI1]|uniref:hypothetical protein n=1 Tax=Endozoicomonas sp. YOMI1 TaxID=2828739 RepID=UPI002147DA72|nr:hypothetical protein [Endozoicomonas sp. YOMI1]
MNKNPIKNPFVFTKTGKVLTVNDPLPLSEELYDSPAFGATLTPVAIGPDKVTSHFRLDKPNRSARGEEGHNDGTEKHIKTQMYYLQKGYTIEESLIFSDGSMYVLDCYDCRTNHIVEVVDNHGDIDKARALKALGFKVTWHFVSEKVNDMRYKKYGEVIRDY